MEYLTLIVTGSLGALLGYLLAYTNEKAKNKALKEDIAEITKEKEAVLADSRLQHEKRKHQYERKQEVYSKYHQLLDNFNEKNPILDNSKMEFLLSEMLNRMKANPNNEGEHMKAINTFSDEINILIREYFVGIQDIAKQTNGIKLVATIEICELVEKIDSNYRKSEELWSLFHEDFTKMLRRQENFDFTTLNPEIKNLRIETIEFASTLIKLMRADLDTI